MKIFKGPLVILGILFYFGQVFAINHYKHFASDVWDVHSQLTYLKTNSNFNTSGNIVDLPKSNYYQLTNITTGGRYGVSDVFNGYGDFNIGNAESNGTDAVRTNSTLNQISVGGEFLLGNDFPQIIPEFSILMDLEKIDNSQDNVMNSEGANKYTGKLNLQFDLNRFYLFGYLGYSYRDKGRSNQLPWGVNAEWTFANMTLGGELFGFQSASDDKDKGTDGEAVRDALRSRVNGGSAQFYTVNPSVIDSNIYFKAALGRDFVLWFAGGIPLIGNNYANGFHGETGLRWIFGTEPFKHVRKKAVSIPVDEGSRISTDKKVDKFREDTEDGVDQRIFRATPTARPAHKPVYSAPPEDLKEKMDDVEMKIELRSNKKKKRRP